jgi:D-amino-acid dehydrogenase
MNVAGMDAKHVVVIGGGVVGIACALEMQDHGYRVTVLEPGVPGEGASWASCGSIAVSEVIPLSKPGMLARVPGWLLDPVGPLAMRPSALVSQIPWMLRFAANARPARIDAIAKEITSISALALDDTKSFLARLGLSNLVGSRPIIELYDTAEERAHERPYHDKRRALGFAIRDISGAEAHEMEPAIASDFACAAVMDDWRSIKDPKGFVAALHRAFVTRGGTVHPMAATGFDRQGARVTAVRDAAGQRVEADEVIVAAGMASRALAAGIGIRLRMEGVIGYQTSLTDPGVEVLHGLIYAKGGFGITPYESCLTVAGSIQCARPDAAPDWRRADTLVQKARRVLPGLQTESGKKRIGRRPLTPDTKPIIGRAQVVENVIFATGHGQLGITLAATTARFVSQIISTDRPNVDLTPFSPDRFKAGVFV